MSHQRAVGFLIYIDLFCECFVQELETLVVLHSGHEKILQDLNNLHKIQLI
jgi:hypothetical protein